MAKDSGHKRAGYDRKVDAAALESVTNWAAKGCTMAEIAHNLGINPATLYRWKREHSELEKAIGAGRRMSIQAIENSLFKQAMGEVWEEQETIEEDVVDGKHHVRKRRVRTKKAPSTAATIFYLKNRAGYRDNPAPRPEDVAAGMPDDPLSAALDEVARGLEDGRHGA
ncbi:transposase [Mitsuokella sp.]|uniref:transposase n=1 Tax=Mitsuokella sp. TaxID=2049034 RepID=UPI002A7F1639|nr:transposase [Mitsuokella sp.]MDY4474713.1 transposase [Mitsuokella sp.]